MARAKHFIIVALLIAVSTVALRFLFRFIFATPVAASAEAIPIDTLFDAHFWMIAFLFALIMVIMIYSAAVFRRKAGDETDAPHVHGNTALEISWTVVPTIVVIGFGLWGAAMLNDLIAAKPNEMTINVTGRQWAWTFGYPEAGDFGSGELVLAVDQPIVLQMESEDVLHSFWVPEFRVKQDLVPGRVIPLRFTPTLIGEYEVVCAEMCGLQHTTMVAPVRVVSEEDFDAWVEERLAQPLFGEMSPEERGALWHSAEGFACAGCHSLDGTPGAGPTWQGLDGREEPLTDGTTVTADDDYIRNSIINPNDQVVVGFNPNVMPQNYEELFAAQEAEIAAAEGIEIDIIDDLIAFIQTLE